MRDLRAGVSVRRAAGHAEITGTGVTQTVRPLSEWVLESRPRQGRGHGTHRQRRRRALAVAATLLLLAGLVLLVDPAAAPPGCAPAP